ncbi:hypothetical protein HELRODRAFT_175996 [Helobdella robusta]|uniref:Uncharacterized protein n=1 Tax=Helobdella robusta TaxID=6412 RepID=T1FA04_HELRO|nr:hypothetical protein HELRODRAFT_175996 [Helobdella robusta]ESO00171.1 hypothetical protein HELRODRAFT_175996 [Helobdella robusta]
MTVLRNNMKESSSKEIACSDAHLEPSTVLTSEKFESSSAATSEKFESSSAPNSNEFEPYAAVASEKTLFFMEKENKLYVYLISPHMNPLNLILTILYLILIIPGSAFA